MAWNDWLNLCLAGIAAVTGGAGCWLTWKGVREARIAQRENRLEPHLLAITQNIESSFTAYHQQVMISNTITKRAKRVGATRDEAIEAAVIGFMNRGAPNPDVLGEALIAKLWDEPTS